MSFAEAPEPTEAQQILAKLDVLDQRIVAHTEALNGLGKNVQWIIDNVQGIFQMFSNPAFLSRIPQMMGGMPNAGPGPDGPPAE